MLRCIFIALSFAFICEGNAFADDPICESDETLVNGECIPVCDNSTINFEYTDPDTGTTTCTKNKFQVTTTDDTDHFTFLMAAKGTFYINWGDGTIEKYTPTTINPTEYNHIYSATQSYTIRFGGQATAYNGAASINCGAITFGKSGTNNTYDKVAEASGTLGSLFPPINNRNPRFLYIFQGCTNLTTLPDYLFDGYSGQITSYSFDSSFKGCTSLTSLPEHLFGREPLNPTSNVFRWTFTNCTGLTSIPPGLFSGISGAPANSMFYQTFSGCTGLTSIPSGLFAGISGAPANSMYLGTFYGCSNITGAIPDRLFGTFNNAPAPSMFKETFSGCTKLGSENGVPTYGIPSNLFTGISGAPASSMFEYTFNGCSNLTGPIPSGLFSGISGVPASTMYRGTFFKCSNLTGAIPDRLFGNINGAPASLMFGDTFSGCTKLGSENGVPTYGIPTNLFSGINGDAAQYMFLGTFEKCSNLVGSVPSLGTFSGAPQKLMFSSTFNGCTNLTGTIPSNLFAGITGAPVDRAFYITFEDTHLSGFRYPDGSTTTYIPSTFFANITNTNYTSGPMVSIFRFTNLATSCPANMYQYITGFEVDFNGKVSCVPCPSGLVSPAGSTDVSQCVEPSIDLNWYNGETLVSSTTCTVGDTINLPSAPIREGYDFVGWKLQTNNE